MSGQWEQYVDKATTELELFRPEVERVVALVGPLIAEDTRVRMVEAAGRAVERDDITPAYQPSMKQLALINNALLSGSGMTQANVAFRELCRGYGVDRFALEDER